MNWYTYVISPIDMGWENLKTVKETTINLASYSSLAELDNDLSIVQSFLSDWESAKTAAKTAGWEGDFSNDPVVIWLPNDSEFTYGFVVKQDNNGTTYVISPVAMPWLDHA